MRVLVTGGTGYIGSHTVVELIHEGHDVTIIDNLANSKRSVLDRIGKITGLTPAFHVVDIRDAVGLREVFADVRPEAVVHFAGLKAVGESVDKPLDYYDVNVGGSVRLFEVMRQAGTHTIVFSSSATVYGDPATVPVREDMPLQPATNPYGASKAMIERILQDLGLAEPSWASGLLRYFNPVGAHPSGLIGEDPNGEPNNLMPYITQVAAEKLPRLRVFGDDYDTPDGTGVRDYIHVVDLARAHVAALDYLSGHRGTHVWNLGTGRGTSVLELVAAFERVTGVRVPYEIVGRREGDIAATWAEPGLANQQLGWTAELTTDDMCADGWRWQQYALGLER